MWLSFFIYSVLTALLPGPNNILAINSTMSIGFQRSRPLLWGIYAGFTTIIFLSAVFTDFLAGSLTTVFQYLRYVGAIYLVYLAWTVIKSKPIDTSDLDSQDVPNGKKNDFWKGFVLQFVNVKIIIYGITAFSSFVLPNYQTVIVIIGFAMFLSFVGSAATFIWAIAGQKLAIFLNKHFKTVNITMAILLLYCAVSLFL